MAQIIYSARAFSDLERLADFLLDAGPVVARSTVDLVLEAVEVLANHPLIGRPAENNLRELVISRGRSGCMALYSYEQSLDTVLVLAVRHQREAAYLPEPDA